MPDAMSASLNRATFALQSRLFVAMKRAGRVIDLVWLQHNAEYARAVLATADAMGDAEVREIATRLRQLLADYLAQGSTRPAALRSAPPPTAPTATPTPAPPGPSTAPPASARTPMPEATPVAPDAAARAAELDRHLTSLR